MTALPPLAAEPIFNISHLTVTNSYINSTLAVVGFVIFVVFLNHGIKKYYGSDSAPKGLVNFFESILEFMFQYLDQVTGDRKKSLKFLPIVGTLFLFILVSNWIGLFPGIGSIGVYQVHNNSVELIPLLRPANTDLNMTLAMGVFVILTVQVLGIAAIGFFKYANKFIKLGDLYTAFKSLKPVNILVAIIEFFVGLIEIISSIIAPMLSLSLRLFGNIFAGEVLMTVLAGLIPYFVPLPFMALEMLVGIVQATVFAMLALVYLSIATTEPHGHEDNDKHGAADHVATDISEVEAV